MSIVAEIVDSLEVSESDAQAQLEALRAQCERLGDVQTREALRTILSDLSGYDEIYAIERFALRKGLTALRQIARDDAALREIALYFVDCITGVL